MRTFLIASVILLILGATLLNYGLTRGALSEWRSGNLPYPGNGFTTLDDFRLYRGGRFEMQVLSPCTQEERDAVSEDIVPTNFRVVVQGVNGFRLERSIKSLRVGSWSQMGRTFSPGDVWILPSGKYEIRIEGHGATPGIFRDRGAAIYLERMEPVGPDIGIELSAYVGYSLLSVAAILIVFCSVWLNRSLPKQQPREPSST